MSAQREKFSSKASSELLKRMREIARRDGRHFQAVLEDAMRDYIASQAHENVRPEVMTHYKASVERNRRLYKLLAE